MEQPLSQTSFEQDFELHLDRPLGDGMSGTVYACTRRADGLECAVKFLGATKAAAEEIRLHQYCAQHVAFGVVQPVAVYENVVLRRLPGLPFARRHVLVLEYMRHGDLFTLLSRNKGALSERTAAQVLVSAARTLAALHALEVTHRDIKLENFMVVRDDPADPERVRVKLTDFGFAKQGTGMQTPLGTGYYLSPEMVHASREQRRQSILGTPSKFEYDPKCDVWSLGVCYYMLLVNYAPFRTDIPNLPLNHEMRERIVRGDWGFRPAHLWQHISETSKDLIRQLLVVDPKARMSAAALARNIGLAGLAGVPAAMPARSLVLDTPAMRFMARHAANSNRNNADSNDNSNNNNSNNTSCGAGTAGLSPVQEEPSSMSIDSHDTPPCCSS